MEEGDSATGVSECGAGLSRAVGYGGGFPGLRGCPLAPAGAAPARSRCPARVPPGWRGRAGSGVVSRRSGKPPERGAQRGLGLTVPGPVAGGGDLGERARLVARLLGLLLRSGGPPVAVGRRRALCAVGCRREGGRRGAVLVLEEQPPAENLLVPAGAREPGPRFAGNPVVSSSCCPAESTGSRTPDQNVFSPPPPPPRRLLTWVLRGLNLMQSGV